VQCLPTSVSGEGLERGCQLGMAGPMGWSKSFLRGASILAEIVAVIRGPEQCLATRRSQTGSFNRGEMKMRLPEGRKTREPEKMHEKNLGALSKGGARIAGGPKMESASPLRG
jgi:hypothetical protein